jgi:hypothetical protein
MALNKSVERMAKSHSEATRTWINFITTSRSHREMNDLHRLSRHNSTHCSCVSGTGAEHNVKSFTRLCQVQNSLQPQSVIRVCIAE